MIYQKAIVHFETPYDPDRSLVIVAKYIFARSATLLDPPEPEDFWIQNTYALDGEPISQALVDELIAKHRDSIMEQLRTDFFDYREYCSEERWRYE